MIHRREFVVGGGAAAWPMMARAQQSAMPVIGFLNALGRNDRPNLPEAFRRGLSEAGYVEGRNIAIEYRFAENQYEQLPALATDLVGRNVAAIAATGGGSSILAAKASTTTIPIVFTTAGDPIQEGYVASLNRPEGNATGISWFGTLIGGKALGLLRELVPNAAVVALMTNPKLPEAARMVGEVQNAARTLGQQLLVLNASTPSEIDTVFATLRQRGVGALLVGSDPFLTARRQQIVALAARDLVPAMYLNPDFCHRGWADGLWQRHRRRVSPGRSLRRTDFEGRKAGRSAGRAGHQICVRDQSQDRQGARARSASEALVLCRRGD